MNDSTLEERLRQGAAALPEQLRSRVMAECRRQLPVPANTHRGPSRLIWACGIACLMHWAAIGYLETQTKQLLYGEPDGELGVNPRFPNLSALANRRVQLLALLNEKAMNSIKGGEADVTR